MMAEGDQETSEKQFVLELFHQTTIHLEDIDQASAMVVWLQGGGWYMHLEVDPLVRRDYLKINSRMPSVRLSSLNLLRASS